MLSDSAPTQPELLHRKHPIAGKAGAKLLVHGMGPEDMLLGQWFHTFVPRIFFCCGAVAFASQKDGRGSSVVTILALKRVDFCFCAQFSLWTSSPLRRDEGDLTW